MAMTLVAEREEPVERTPLRLVEAVRDIETELEQARALALKQGYDEGVRQASAEYSRQLAQRMPRAPLAAALIPVLEKIALLVGIRAMLAAAVIMTFILALQAMERPATLPIVVLVMFGLIVVAPLAWLASRRTG